MKLASSHYLRQRGSGLGIDRLKPALGKGPGLSPETDYLSVSTDVRFGSWLCENPFPGCFGARLTSSTMAITHERVVMAAS